MNPGEAECTICRARMPANVEMMNVHMLTYHPLELLQHPTVAKAVTSAAFNLGTKLAEVFKR